MRRRRLLGPLAIAALSTAFGGCSFAFVNGPPANHRTSPFFTCTSSNALPMLDTVATAIGVLDAVSVATDSGSNGSTTTGARTGNAIALGAGAALLAASAAYGYKKTSECREAEADLVRRTPVFTGAPDPFAPGAPRGPRAPQLPYDPWVAHPPAGSAAPVAPGPPPAAAPGAPAGDSTPWDPGSTGK